MLDEAEVGGTFEVTEEMFLCRGSSILLAHSPVLVPGVGKSSDEDELDEDEGKPSHHADVMPG